MFYEIFSNVVNPTCGAGLRSAKTPLVLAFEVGNHASTDFAELTGSGHILGSNSENSNLLPVAVE